MYCRTASPAAILPAPPFLSSIQTACQDIADTIRQQASCARDGGVYWRQPIHPAGLKPALVGPHLFPGTVGIALFLAAAGHVLDEEDLLDLARHALEPLRREIRELAADPVRAG